MMLYGQSVFVCIVSGITLWNPLMDRQQIGLKLALDALGQALDLSDFDRRLILQKSIYLVQAAKVDLGYTFHWYLRGPYSSGLTRDAFGLHAELTQNPDELKDWKLDIVSLERLARLKEVIKSIPSPRLAPQLELLASVHFLLQTRQAKSTDIGGLRTVLLKNNKDFSESAIQQAIQDLKKNELFPVVVEPR
jgi:hypothetical protein